MQSADQSTANSQPPNTNDNATDFTTTTGGLHISEPNQTSLTTPIFDSFHTTLPPYVQRQFLQDAEYHRLYDVIGHLREAKCWLQNQQMPAHEAYWREVTGRGLMLAVEKVEEDLENRARMLTEEYAAGNGGRDSMGAREGHGGN